MEGNVWQWCLNKYEKPKGWRATKIDKSGRRLIRGGSWGHGPGYLRSSYRGGDIIDFGDFGIGFRLAQDLN